MNRTKTFAIPLAAAALVALPALSFRRFRGWQRTWGATEDELLRVMPGDDDSAAYRVTRAITIEADPEDIYPWLVQMGYRRGGLYSWDFLDRLFGFLDGPSAKEILPEFQHLEPGDIIPVGRGGDFPVADLEENEYLYLGGEVDGTRWTWTTGLYPTGGGQTRLVTRNTGRGGAFSRRFFMAGMDLAAFIMVHRWLNVLKRRAEKLHAERAAERVGEVVALT